MDPKEAGKMYGKLVASSISRMPSNDSNPSGGGLVDSGITFHPSISSMKWVGGPLHDVPSYSEVQDDGTIRILEQKGAIGGAPAMFSRLPKTGEKLPPLANGEAVTVDADGKYVAPPKPTPKKVIKGKAGKFTPTPKWVPPSSWTDYVK